MIHPPFQRLLLVLSGLACTCLPVLAQQATTESAVKLAGLYLKLGQNDQCRATLDSLLKTEPKNPEILIILGRLEIKQGHAEAALKAAAGALAAAPDNIAATVVKARALALQGDKPAALKVLSQVPSGELEKYEDDLDSSGLNPVRTDDTGNPPSTATSDDLLDASLESARNALAKKDLEKADKFTAAALKSAPTNSDAVALRADYLSQAGKADEAVALLKKLKATSHKQPFTEELALGFALQDAGKADEARRSFEFVAGNSAYDAADREQARQALTGLDAAKTLTQGDAAMDAGNAKEALRIAEEVLRKDPGNDDAKVLQARAFAATGKAHQAVETLSAMKAKVSPGQHFDAQLAYANALAADHRYLDSVAAYDEVLAKPDLYNADERKDAGEQLDDLRENHLAGADVQVMYGSFEEGKLWRTTGKFFSTRSGRTRYSASIEWDNVHLDDKIYPRSLTEDRSSSSITFDTIWDDQWRTFLHVGGFGNGALGGATIDYTLPGGIVLGLSADYNDPAKDTLLLAAMDGRQHALTANLTVPLGKHFVIESQIIGRKLEADGADIGNSIGTETQVRWHPVSTSDQLYFAYALELKDFRPNDSSFDQRALNFFGHGSPFTPSATDAVPDHINRHALQVHDSFAILTNVTASALGEVAWRQESQAVEFGAVAELLWRATQKASISARFEYYSGGSGPNAGEGVMMGTIGTKITW